MREAMLCQRCQSVVHQAGSLLFPRPMGRLGNGAMRAGVLCAGCGRLLPAAGMAERLFAKLCELSRFGLLDRAAPILKPPVPRGPSPFEEGL